MRAQAAMVCDSCDSTTTYITKEGYPQWHYRFGGVLCDKCYRYYIHNPIFNPTFNPKWNPINNAKKIKFKGKYIVLKEPVRIGQCSKCFRKVGEGIKQTQMHHLEYHEDDPLKDTIELCVSCHRKVHKN